MDVRKANRMILILIILITITLIVINVGSSPDEGEGAGPPSAVADGDGGVGALADGGLFPKLINLGKDATGLGREADGGDGDGAAQTPGLGDQSGEDGSPPSARPTPPEIDLEAVKPNESGFIMVVMFHKFAESFTPTQADPGEYIMTFDAFRDLLHTLYDRDYRLISMSDYLNNHIDVPAGCVPIVFTFDDATSSQFSLIRNGEGELEVDPNTAVGILLEFNETHPDFGVKGLISVCMKMGIFSGIGTVTEKLAILTGLGFEIGNHTTNHTVLSGVNDKAVLQQLLGENQAMVNDALGSYDMEVFTLPQGAMPPRDIREYLYKGWYETTSYEHKGVLLVGADPARPPGHVDYSREIPRVRASGVKLVDYDLTYYLDLLLRSSEYVSDGDPYTVTVPANKADKMDPDVIEAQGRTLRIY
ncbi:MAG: polysaccharide deacetylase [Oscillospiraceae bacterium]|nr:polysaccharide deacetylase [Oscillospiraceae bacterium]